MPKHVTVGANAQTVENDKNLASIDGEITTVANDELDNADTSYTYFNLAMHGWRKFSMHHIIEATTITYEATNDDYSVDNASANWRDVTSLITGGTASFTATGMFISGDNLPLARLRVKRVTTNATNSLKLILCRTN